MKATLEDYRDKPGTKLRMGCGTPIMILALAVGMIQSGGRRSGGKDTVAVVNLMSGECQFWHGSAEVHPMPPKRALRIIRDLIDSLSYINKNFPGTSGYSVRHERIEAAEAFLNEIGAA